MEEYYFKETLILGLHPSLISKVASILESIRKAEMFQMLLFLLILFIDSCWH